MCVLAGGGEGGGGGEGVLTWLACYHQTDSVNRNKKDCCYCVCISREFWSCPLLNLD